MSTHIPHSPCFRDRLSKKPTFQAVLSNRAIIKIESLWFFFLILKQLIVSANLVCIVHREGTAPETDSTLAGTEWNSTLGWKGRQDRQGVGGGDLTGGALRGYVSWSRKVWKEGPSILLGKFWREGAGSFSSEAGRGCALQKSSENHESVWDDPATWAF